MAPTSAADAPAGAPAGATRSDSRGPRPSPLPVNAVLLAAFGLTCGLSAFAGGFYDLSDWGVLGLAALGLLVALAAAGPVRVRPRAIVAVAGLAFLAFFSWLSIGWAESAGQAAVEANRWLLYAVLVAVLVALMRAPRLGLVALGGAAAGVLVVAVHLYSELLSGDGAALFLGARLNKPVGYVNGQAAHLLLAVWPCVALAERARWPWLGGLGVAGAVALGGLLILSQTRAVLPALAISAVLMLAVVPGRTRRAWILLAVTGGLLLAGGGLLDVYDRAAGSVPAAGDLERAGGDALVAALLAGALWAAADFGAAAARKGPKRARTLLPRAGTGALVALIAVGCAIGLARAGEIRDFADRQYDQFVNVNATAGGPESRSRFLSGGGARHDYWRIALNQFKDHPVRGIGAGNYDRTYFLERRTGEDVRQPHSVELQALAETGLLGLAGLLAFVGAALAGFVRSARAARGSPLAGAVAVAAGGSFLVWLLHASVDWIHLLPGLTGVGLTGAAALLAGRRRAPRPRWPGRARLVLVASALLVAAVGALALGRATAADRLREQGREMLVRDPAEALRHARRSLSFDDRSIEGRYLAAAAYARLDRYDEARASLVAAVRLEPHEFVTWALLGDLAARRGDLPAARRAYRRAAELNPRDTALQALTKSPLVAVASG